VGRHSRLQAEPLAQNVALIKGVAVAALLNSLNSSPLRLNDQTFFVRDFG
jgi:hypothetical protein